MLKQIKHPEPMPGEPNSRTFVKICGISKFVEAEAAMVSGANAVGFVFAESPRRVSASQANEIARRIHPSVLKIGVFVDSPLERVLATVGAAGLDGVQLHGSEDPGFAAGLKKALPGLMVIKAIRVTEKTGPGQAAEFAQAVDAVMLDRKDVADPAARVEPIPVGWLKGLAMQNIVVAGGLSPENVQEVVRLLHPWGVDASGGLESAPGVKDPARVHAFVRAVRQAEDVA